MEMEEHLPRDPYTVRQIYQSTKAYFPRKYFINATLEKWDLGIDTRTTWKVLLFALDLLVTEGRRQGFFDINQST